MKDSKLILLLKTFSITERRRFGEFLASPFFNKNKELLRFYKYLKIGFPEFNHKKINKELLFQKMYPSQIYIAKTIEDLIHHLLKYSEKFLRILYLEQEEYMSNILISEALVDRKLEKHYRFYRKESEKILKSNKYYDSNYYLFKYQLSDIALKHFTSQKQRKNDPNLQATLNNLDTFYFFNKLKYSCERLANKDVIAEDFKLSFSEEVVSYLLSKKRILPPLILVYLTAYLVLRNENSETYFLELVNLLSDYDSIICDTDKNSLYLFAINYCVLQMKQNNNASFYVSQCLELYLKGIHQKFLYQNGYLSPWTFKNVVKLGINLKKFDWTTIFIQTYHTHLEEHFREDAFYYSLADLNYRKQNYDKALSHLMQVQYSDIFYSLGAKTMLIKIYQETNEEEALLSMIASFTIYLKRNKKIANNFRQTYLNFASLINQLQKVKAHKLSALIEKIKTTEPLTDRRWLLKMSETYKKG